MDKLAENLSLLKDIRDIYDILNQYRQTGWMNREKAISKIRELRITNKDIKEATIATLPLNPVPFSEARDNQLADELEVYAAILQDEYLRNMKEENSHANTGMDR